MKTQATIVFSADTPQEYAQMIAWLDLEVPDFTNILSRQDKAGPRTSTIVLETETHTVPGT